MKNIAVPDQNSPSAKNEPNQASQNEPSNMVCAQTPISRISPGRSRFDVDGLMIISHYLQVNESANPSDAYFEMYIADNIRKS